MNFKLLIYLFLINKCLYSQTLRTNDNNFYLVEIVETKMVFTKQIKISNKPQFFYEGKIKVVNKITNKITFFQFSLNIWSKKYKNITFVYNNKKYKNIFINNFLIKIDTSIKKVDGKNIYSVILSSLRAFIE